jgi:cell surface protein SprA
MSRSANVPNPPHTSPHWHIGVLGRYKISLFGAFLALNLIFLGAFEAFSQRDTVRTDSVSNLPYKSSRKPTFRLRDRYGDPFSNTSTESPLFLKDPTKVNMEVELDSNLNYTIYEKMGELNYRPVTTMSFDEFNAHQDRQILKGYWQGKSRSMDGESPVTSRGLIPKIFISPILDRIFGGSYVELIPRGFVTLDFGGSFQRISNPSIPIRQQRNGGFEFDQQINMSVTGKVGEKLSVNANFDNNNSFDFQNNMKVEYTGFKEDILQKLEIGNVSLPLNNTLIQGSQNLFGIKAQLQFGKLYVTAVASTQRGKVESINIPGGSNGQGRPFEFVASQYDESRHFFLGHFFRDNYEKWLRTTPQIISGINITRVEVYLINRSNDTQTMRSVLGLADLGEFNKIYNTTIVDQKGSDPAASNLANSLWTDINSFSSAQRENDAILETLQPNTGLGLVNGTDFEKINGARKLAPTEYTFHKQLGYITLSRKLQSDEALAVAYEYVYNGQTYKVGELSEDYGSRPESEVIFLKLLRTRDYFPTNAAGKPLPMWDLMMKNIYNLNVSQLTREGFQLRVIYRDDKTGIDNPQIQEGSVARNRQLIEIVGLDRLNPVNDPPGDGNFDFIEGLTINSQNGTIIFPYLEPYNTPLRAAFANEPTRDAMISKYVFDTLYRIPKAQAERLATKNKFYIVGTYTATGSSKNIQIPGFGVTPGSVRVYAGGTPLIEQQDFVVDYTFGTVTILNDAILNSGKNITVDYEQSDPFAFQTRSLLGTRFDYKLNDDVTFGSTVLYYNERPLITRNLIGTEPARNLQYGLDFNVRKNSRLLTKWVDAIPGIQTKEMSSFNWSGEFAQLLPGTSNIVDGSGTAYIDDFENTATPYSLLSPVAWRLSSIPKTVNNEFDGNVNGLAKNYRRAKLAWYQIDNQFYREGGQFKPDNISDSDLKNNYVRAVSPTEIFPKRFRTQGNFFETILDLAYYPTERGPYNYNPDLKNQVDPDNKKFAELPGDPRDNWAGITTAIRTEVDFNKANIEYVEFWLMDPFISGPNGRVIVRGNEGINNTTGGKLVFHLGNVSEDVLPDSKHAFENGLPPDGNLALADDTEWGYVPSQQYITNAFDNSPSSRKNQDVGLDGISSLNENDFFKQDFIDLLNLGAEELETVKADPSADNFNYFLGGDLDARDAQLLERYRDYNGMENNTPIITGNDVIARSGSPYPDNEDLNVDNTISELEEYYRYEIDLKAGDLDIGKHYIVDKLVPKEHPDATWYLFRIPIQNFKDSYGNISGFTSIRYARMILTDWKDPVVLRFANFRMVGARWLRYTDNLRESGLIEDQEKNFDNFTISVVNIEENSGVDESGVKSPYVVPPGFIRDRDNTSSIARQLNEQSVQVCIDELKDADARAIYKPVGMDFFNYGRVKMFIHANSDLTQDDELTVFMRMGTDYDENYYEVELPLKITRPATSSDPKVIWPEANEFDIVLDDLYALKTRRDREHHSLDEVYQWPTTVGRNTLRIRGRPDLTQVKILMIGVRNPRSADKKTHSVCLWANELRLTDFDRTPGWAVNTTLSTKLADFATVTGSLRYTTFGFGAVSSKISERTRNETTAYDITANVNLDKLFLGSTGIKLPMLVSYQNTTINPKFDPANPDLRLNAAMKSFNTERERDAYIKLIRDRTVTRSINFTNVRKVKLNPESKSHFYDVENLAFNYSFSETSQRSFTIQEAIRRNYKGGAAYSFSPKATGIEPFKKSKSFKSPYLKFIKDFNFSLMPSNVTVRGDLERSFIKNVYRNSLSNSTPQYQKYFTFNRLYSVEWDLSKSLSLDYQATVNAIIDEPEGEGEEVDEEIKRNLKKFGRMKNFDQRLTANYTVPLDKFPLTDWIGAEYRYQVSYNWRAGPLNKPDDPSNLNDPKNLPDYLDFKNTITNSRERNITGRLDMVKLYNKVTFLRDINSPPKPVKPKSNKQVDTVRTATPAAIRGFARLLMSVRSINGSYTITDGTLLPGFAPSPRLFGMDQDFDAPGWKFILGSQDPNIRLKAAEKGWLAKKESLTTPFTQSRTRAFSARANVDPITDLKIQLDIKKDVMDSYQENFRFDSVFALTHETGFRSFNPNRVGSYKISTVTINTAFDKSNNNKSSAVFHQFEKNLDTILKRFRTATGQSEYDSAGQDVAIAAFIAAYRGKSASTISLSPFPKTPLPNWRIDYNGLTRLEIFKNAFQAITISHAYSSTYSVVNFSNSLKYAKSDTVAMNVPLEDYNTRYFGRSFGNDIVPIYVISQVLISEQFSPLIGINVRTKNRLTIRADYKTKRDLALNISNAQVTEVSTKDVSFELGYTKNNMKLPIKAQGRTIVLKNDVTFRMNVTVSDSKTIQRKIEQQNTVTSGNINFQLRPNISYVLNQKLSIQMYYERTVNEPAVSNSFRRATTRFGAQIRFSLAQ